MQHKGSHTSSYCFALRYILPMAGYFSRTCHSSIESIAPQFACESKPPLSSEAIWCVMKKLSDRIGEFCNVLICFEFFSLATKACCDRLFSVLTPLRHRVGPCMFSGVAPGAMKYCSFLMLCPWCLELLLCGISHLNMTGNYWDHCWRRSLDPKIPRVLWKCSDQLLYIWKNLVATKAHLVPLTSKTIADWCNTIDTDNWYSTLS